MKKTLLIVFFLLLPANLNAENISKVYFAGGCFWCMEESFDKVNGVIETISGYSGGHVKNPKYKDVVKNTTGHYETLEITYNSSITNFEKLLEIYWINIDPFDADGQFCDKGESYKAVVFFKDKPDKRSSINYNRKIKLNFYPNTSSPTPTIHPMHKYVNMKSALL